MFDFNAYLIIIVQSLNSINNIIYYNLWCCAVAITTLPIKFLKKSNLNLSIL